MGIPFAGRLLQFSKGFRNSSWCGSSWALLLDVLGTSGTVESLLAPSEELECWLLPGQDSSRDLGFWQVALSSVRGI